MTTREILSEFKKKNLTVTDNLYLLAKYNLHGELDVYLAYYFTFAQYYLYLASNSLSTRKWDIWKEFVIKDFGEKYDLSMQKDFVEMFNLKERKVNVSLWEVLKPQNDKYLINDIITRFEKYYGTRDFAAERKAKLATPVMDKIYSRFGEEKGNNLCAAVFTLAFYCIPPENWNLGIDMFVDLWLSHCNDQISRIYGAQGIVDFNEARGLANPIIDFTEEILKLGDEEYTIATWILSFRERCEMLI